MKIPEYFKHKKYQIGDVLSCSNIPTAFIVNVSDNEITYIEKYGKRIEIFNLSYIDFERNCAITDIEGNINRYVFEYELTNVDKIKNMINNILPDLNIYSNRHNYEEIIRQINIFKILL